MLYTLIYTNPKSVSTFWGNCTQRETHLYSQPRKRPDILRKSTKNFIASNLMQLSFLSIRKILTTIKNRHATKTSCKSCKLLNFLKQFFSIIFVYQYIFFCKITLYQSIKVTRHYYLQERVSRVCFHSHSQYSVIWYMLGNFCSFKQKSRTLMYKSCELFGNFPAFGKFFQFQVFGIFPAFWDFSSFLDFFPAFF